MSTFTHVYQTKTPLQIIAIGRISNIVGRYLQFLPTVLRNGLTGMDIQSSVLRYLRSKGVHACLKGYRNFPQDISVSVNEEITHGVPTAVPFCDGDIVKVDIVAGKEGYYSDSLWTYGIGDMLDCDIYLMEAAWKVCKAAIDVCRVGNRLCDLAEAAQKEANALGVYVLYQFVGHGVGTDIHEEPIVRFDVQASRAKILPGTVVCIEPIVSLERIVPQQSPDGRYLTKKKKKTAVYEHVVATYPRFSRVLSYNLCNTEDFPCMPSFIAEKKGVINY